MAAAQWRKAMNSAAAATAARARPGMPMPVPVRPTASPIVTAGTSWAGFWRQFGWGHLAALVLLLVFPFVASPFVTFQVGAQSLVLGMIALSLSFLAGYGGMISLAQMTVAGVAGYSMAVFGHSSSAEISLGWPWWLAVPVAIFVAVLASTLIGWLSVRTEGIYTIMITLAIGVAFYYLVLQNYSVFNGFQGLRELHPPKLLGINWRNAVPFYGLALVCALAAYWLIYHVVRTPFGIALQGIRDNPRRMAALGYSVVSHRVAAYALSGLVAAVGGVLLAWYNALISPGSVGTSWLINILVIAVLGGVRHPAGAFLGALVFVLLQTFAIDLIDRERFNLVIGGVFLAIVLFSPDGLLGLWARLTSRLRPGRALTSNQRRQP